MKINYKVAKNTIFYYETEITINKEENTYNFRHTIKKYFGKVQLSITQRQRSCKYKISLL